MKVFTCVEIAGYYPVGSAAVVVAGSRKTAKKLLEAKLAEMGLKQDIAIEYLIELDVTTPGAIVLMDGNY